jgi:GMP synthase (glutamine-hydrolysing)
MTTPTRLLILKLGDTLPALKATHGDFEDWIAQGLRTSEHPVQVSVLDPRHGDALPRLALNTTTPQAFDGVVLTGSHAMVTHREAWSEHTAAWLRDAVHIGLPVLGICYGHQLLAHALGGTVNDHPGGLESGTTLIWRQPDADDDPLFADMPSHWHAQVSHRQTVSQLPHGAVALAHNRFEPHHAFRFGACAWGVQFHPEFMPEATRTYLLHQTVALTEQGQDPQRMQTEVQPTPEAASLLGRFATWVATHRKTVARAASAPPPVPA